MREDGGDLVIWSKFGLWRFITWAELPGVIEATAEQVKADHESKGFCLTWCDVEPVAVMLDYPEDKEPDEVLAWVTQETKPDDSHEFLFDVEMRAAIRVRAKTKEEAIALIAGIVGNEGNLGAWPNGDPIICEISSRAISLAEIDGESV